MEPMVAEPAGPSDLATCRRLLRQAQDQLEGVQQAANAAVWEWDPVADRVEGSPHLWRVLRLPPEPGPVALEALLQRIDPQDRSRLAAALAPDQAAGYDLHLKVGDTGGGERLVRARGRLMETDGQRRWSGTFVDVTGTDGPRAAADAQTKRLRELDEYRARFINVAAHELKTPLTPIRVHVELLEGLLGADAPPAVQKSLRALRRGVDRLTQLVGDVLDAARIQSVQLRISLEPVRIGSAVQESVQAYEAVAEELGVKLVAADLDDRTVLADRGRLLQAINNLVSNAIKFTPAGGTVTLEAHVEEGLLQLSVADTGRGMAAEQLTLLFQPFSQVHEDAQATARGTGLGLFITRGIVEAMGGSVEAASDGPGLGSRFTIRLPLAADEDAQARAERAPTSLDRRLRDLI